MKEKEQFKINWWLLGLSTAATLILLVVGFLLWLSLSFNQTFINGMSLGDLDLSGHKLSEAKSLLQSRQAKLSAGIELSCGSKKLIMPAAEVNGLGVMEENYAVDAEATIEAIKAYGRSGTWLKRLSERLNSLINGQKFYWVVRLDDNLLRKNIQDLCAASEIAMKDAGLLKVQGQWQVSSEIVGRGYDYDASIKQIYKFLTEGINSPVEVKQLSINPQVKADQLAQLLNQVENFVATSTIILTYQDKQWPINTPTVADWIGAKQIDKNIQLTWSEIKINEYLQKNISQQINRVAQEARFTMQDGKPTIYQAAVNGLSLNASSSVAIIIKALEAKTEKAELKVEIIKPTQNSNDLLAGISELLGVGTSSFSGSPANRIHNIKTGAAAANGIIVAPGETFSMIGALGEINAKTGYLQELVIKENRTVPEYGGGLCQVGTTMFRAAIDAGLPIVERRNHSYRVVYYEPAGTDATIYDPSPDLKFMNDTANNILITTKVVGTTARFEIWGTKDGRQVIHTYPTIYNIVKPPPTKLIESPDLKPGQKKCVESAHNGADAYFDYKVTYVDGTVKIKRFSSHYVPWQQVCLIGPTSTVTSTPN